MSPSKVVVTGSESTGKTTLARALARHFQVPWSEEYARAYLEKVGRPLTAADVLPIAAGQQVSEDDALAAADRLAVLDTDLLSTVLYARHYYGSAPETLQVRARARRGDLYLLCHPDVPWSQDGLQRDRGQRREEMHALFVSVLQEFGARVVDIRGPWAERLPLAIAATSALLAEDPVRPPEPPAA